MNKISLLTPQQERAFSRLKKAFADCSKCGITFVNHNNNIDAFNSKYVSGASDVHRDGDVSLDVFSINSFVADIGQWVDVDVYLKLTEEGKKIINSINEESF